MRYSKNVPAGVQVPGNVRLMKWIPQNDLLGHTSTRLFISHGGANSQFEGLYHAVPMIVFPLFGDQPYNAKRGEYKGYSITMDILNFTSNKLVTNINKILQPNSVYKQKIEKGAAIFKSESLNPRQRAAFWIEHVIQHGGQHLRSYALDMPWYEYLMLDIFAFLIVVIVLLLILTYCVLRFVTNMCFRRRATSKVKLQ